MARRLAALAGAGALIVCVSAAAGAAAQADAPQPPEPAVEAPHDSVAESLDEQAPSEQAVEQDAGAEGSDAEAPHTHSALQPEYRRPLPELADDEMAARALARVRERPELQRTRFEERWVLRDFGEDEGDPPFELPPFLLGWVEAMAVAFEYTLWAAVVLALGAFVYFVIAQLRRPGAKVSRDDASMDQSARVHVAGAPAREISAVEALGRARALCEAGRTTEALSMLYVGMIAGFTVASGLRVPAEATEAQCLRLVEGGQVGQARRALFGELVERRLWVAYGHAAIQPSEIEAFCARYATVFEVGR